MGVGEYTAIAFTMKQDNNFAAVQDEIVFNHEYSSLNNLVTYIWRCFMREHAGMHSVYRGVVISLAIAIRI